MSMNEGLAIETDGLSKSYGMLNAVAGLNLEVPQGSIYALIGPNGAGKTTTFLILSTLLERTSGLAWVGGLDPDVDARGVRRILGYMPDFFGVYDDVKVGEYLEFFAAAYRVPQSQRRDVSDKLLELVDLHHKKNDFVEALSRGMKQRLGLARALVHDPQILILDEPASGLDPRARVELRELLLQLRSMGKTILISSHILSELEEVCSHVGILEAGRLLVQGVPAEILAGIAETRFYRLRLSDEASALRAVELLEDYDAVTGVTQSEGLVTFHLSGGEEGAADILAAVAKNGLRVVEFAEQRADLEDLFMRITKGIVQ